MDELVALLDDAGQVCGTAPRSVVRRDNLRHAATGVLVRNSAGDIYVHRRTTTKDVFPGWYDFMAGGVVAAGEEPYEAAVRELAEELGIKGVELERLPEGDYADEFTSYRAYLYACVWDGPIQHQPEEIDWGAWMSPAELLERLEDPDWPFVPDSNTLMVPLIRALV
ncbi:MAG TPA: NUDIX domain-containing protein [Kribbella sp.]|nr:NUDIX domain-containing protein [Kribbella sp.]